MDFNLFRVLTMIDVIIVPVTRTIREIGENQVSELFTVTRSRFYDTKKDSEEDIWNVGRDTWC